MKWNEKFRHPEKIHLIITYNTKTDISRSKSKKFMAVKNYSTINGDCELISCLFYFVISVQALIVH